MNDTQGPHPVEDREDEIDLGQLWAILVNGKWKIAAFVAVALLLGLAYLFVAAPVYSTNALLQVESEGSSGALQGLMEVQQLAGGGAASPAGAEMQIITSRSVLGEAVDKRNLVTNEAPVYFPLIGRPLAERQSGNSEGAAQTVPADQGNWLSHYAWGPARLKVSRLTIPESLHGEVFKLRALGGEQFVLYGPQGQQVLSGRVGAPATGSTVDGHKIQIFVQQLLVTSPPTDFTVTQSPWLLVVESLRNRLAVSEQGDTTGIIRISLEGEDRQAITAIVNTIANVYLRQNVEARSQEAQKSLEFLEEQLPKINAELEAAESRITQYREAYQAVGLDAESMALLEQMVALEEKRSALMLKRAELSETYTGRHPAMAAIQDQLSSLQTQRAQLEEQIGTLPGSQKEMFSLLRDVEVNTVLYTSLLNRAQELRIVEAGTVGNARIIDRPALPVKPVSPKKVLVLALALILGAMLGCGYVFLRAALRREINNPSDIEQMFGLPVYAVIPFSDWLARLTKRARRRRERVPLLARDHPDEVATEALRSLRTSLFFAQMESGNNVLLVTGPAPGVGKSFVSTNLAYLLADTGKKVVVIDADMPRGRLHEFLDYEREPGLSQVLTGQLSTAEALRQVEGTDFHVLASGTVPPNPSELLMRESFQALLTELKAQFDLVIIDAPPILAVTDAAVIASSSPGIITFMVARAGQHPRGELEEAVKRLTRNDNKIAGVVFNGLKKEHAEDAGGYAYYQYEYKAQS